MGVWFSCLTMTRAPKRLPRSGQACWGVAGMWRRTSTSASSISASVNMLSFLSACAGGRGCFLQARLRAPRADHQVGKALRHCRSAHGRQTLAPAHGYPFRAFAYKACLSRRKAKSFSIFPMSSSSPPAILADNLSKTYDRVPAVDALSFRVETGSVVGLLGGNGAGKTTTLAMIMGLTTPTAGSVQVFGADMARERGKVLHRINFESPYADLPHRLTVRQNLSVFGKLYGVPRLKARIEEIAEALDLTQFLDRRT